MGKFLDALYGKNMGSPPVWIMRQAGRYLPEYRAIRERYPFLTMVKTPELAAEVTHLPLQRYPLDAAILFSDILVVAEALGCPVEFHEGVGPVFPSPIKTVADIEALQGEIEKLEYVFAAIRLLVPTLKVPLLGFAGAPFTVASYMVGDKKTAKIWMAKNPESFHSLLEKITTLTIEYLQGQAKAGVAAVQLFESWASELSEPEFRTFSAPYMKRIVESLSIPTIVFGRGTAGFISPLLEIGSQGIGMDYGVHLPEVRKRVGGGVALQGNLDPHALYAPLPTIRKRTKEMVDAMKGDPAYIANLGHGVFPDVSPDAVAAFIESVQA